MGIFARKPFEENNMKILIIVVISMFFIGAVSCKLLQKKNKADLVLMNGVVWTVDLDKPSVEAVAIKGEYILSIGTSKEIKGFIGKHTRVIDLNGRLVLPGFIDSHTHFLEGGLSLSRIQLHEVSSREEFIAKIKAKAAELNKGDWILSGNWDHQRFDPPELPKKDWIDSVTPYNPVCVNRHDGHMLLANSLALKKAGITKYTESPLGGEILKDPKTGEPTGILKDAAMDLVLRVIPEPSLDEKIKAAELALEYANSLGVTSIHDMAGLENFEIYQKLLKDNKLTARISVYMPIKEADNIDGLKKQLSVKNPFLKIAGLKGFVDGSLGSSTALFFDSYLDDPNNRGLLVSDMFPEGVMEKRISLADKNGLQVAVHAIGDKANHMILDIFERVIAQNGKKERRWRIEHAQHLLMEDIQRIASLRVITSVQPYHLVDDGQWAEKKIGNERCRLTYAFKSIIDYEGILACGSDWTVAPLDPLTGIYAAVTRRTRDGKNPQGWFPEQKISLEEAIKGYTLNGAYAEFSEGTKGSIKKGKFADLVVLSHNLFDIPPEKINETEVQITILNGKIIYMK